ncbi:DHA2 family efflux MFS transporter permease subunit [Emcibacter nanhaiensis]|uniref:DHA2 family efflux MFS transporter permease subunit n=1 Tax=Emcibacter nanhaiensis TaxID=1505037 RepID=A0A501PR67_9PROT|nr:DHA2 family efflux MFS transporter permease subunit [Emcibacter nanhaiensis]TPD62572.1 DHA2 family efflux MFS transporter permease subunit [Emcibacter nanhaiensis]
MNAALTQLKSPLQRGLLQVAVMMATIMQAVDTTIANVALPHMQGSMSATQDQMSWVLTSYIVTAAIMIPPTAAIASRIGHKRLFLISVGGFTVASMLCGLATSLSQIIVFRMLQGAFGAALVPLSQTILLNMYPKEKHGKAMTIWSIGVMLGPILGPTLGGYLTEFYNWRWVFFINLPLGLFALVGMISLLPESDLEKPRKFDFLGFALLSLAIGALQLMLDRGESQNWFSSPEIITEAILALVFFYMFIVQMFTVDHPFLDRRIFQDRNFVIGLMFLFYVGILLLATMALMPPFLQNLMGYPVLYVGYLLAPRGLGTMIGLILTGRLTAKLDPRILILAGQLIIAFSLWEMAGFTLEVSSSTIIWTGIVQGVGMGFIIVPLNTAAFATLDHKLRTEGTSIANLVRNIGSSIGISVLITMLARGTQENHAVLAENITPFRAAFFQPSLPLNWEWHFESGVVALNAEVTKQAATIAYLNDFYFLMILTILAAPLVLLLNRNDKQPAPDTAETAELLID